MKHGAAEVVKRRTREGGEIWGGGGDRFKGGEKEKENGEKKN